MSSLADPWKRYQRRSTAADVPHSRRERLRRALHGLVFAPVQIGRLIAPWYKPRPWIRLLPHSGAAILLGLAVYVSIGVAFRRAQATEVPLKPPAEIEPALSIHTPDPLAAVVMERMATIRNYAKVYHISPSLAEKVYDIANSEGLDPDLAFRLVYVESRFNPSARSPVGALGLTQLMPETARALRPGISERQILHPETNLRLGFRFLHYLISQYDGNLRLALLAYNRGPATVDKILKGGGDPANGYARMVLGNVRNAKTPYRGDGMLE